MFFKKNCKTHRKALVLKSLFIEVAGLRSSTLLKKDFDAVVFLSIHLKLYEQLYGKTYTNGSFWKDLQLQIHNRKKIYWLISSNSSEYFLKESYQKLFKEKNLKKLRKIKVLGFPSCFLFVNQCDQLHLCCLMLSFESCYSLFLFFYNFGSFSHLLQKQPS